LPPLSCKLDVAQPNAPGEVCLARLAVAFLRASDEATTIVILSPPPLLYAGRRISLAFSVPLCLGASVATLHCFFAAPFAPLR
jgi:hypothetical protein